MDATPSPALSRRVRPRASLSASEDDEALDAMLVELGIPPDKQKTQKRPRDRNRNEVIELITPPQLKKRGSNAEVVDLISDASSQEDTPMDQLSYSPSESPPLVVMPLSMRTESEEVDITSPIARRDVPKQRTQRAGPRQARRLAGRLRDLHAETTRVDTAPTQSTLTASPTRSRAAGRNAVTAAVAVVQMERSLDTSKGGEKIRSALQNHVYNGKLLPFKVEGALDCCHPGVIRWERRQGDSGGAHVSCAVYYEAEAFLHMLQEKSYKELVRVVRYLQTLGPRAGREVDKSLPSREPEGEEEPSKYFVIVEGMDRALIELKKQQKKKKKQGTSVDSLEISFADLHELAFQLFMDVGAHTKFTCDLDATANYVALVTRELVVASSRVSALEEFLESVPRYNSFRVTRRGGTASACANAWLRMLQVIPGVSEDKAQSLLDHFPTFDSLMCAYRDPNLSREEKEDLVSDKLHDARIERALSKRIFSVFCEENPDALIS